MRGTTVRKVATVFGGSGFIGRYVVQRLAQRDYIVRVAGRHPSAARFLQTQGRVGQIVPLAAAVTDEPAVARAVAGADLVVNLVGILHERRRDDFTRIHTNGAGLVAQLAAAAGIERLVHVSAIGADPASPSAYGRSKGEGEAAVRAAFPQATILRPSIVFGPEDQFFNRFAGMARMLPFMPVVSGATRFQPVYVGDVADAVAAAAEHEEAPGRSYELCGPRAVSFRELLHYILEVTGHRRPLVDMPAGLVRLQARLSEFLPNPPLTRDQLLMLQRDNICTGEAPGLPALGISPKAMEAVVPGYLLRFRPGGGRRPQHAG
ncbi:3-beta-hydroxy-Delta(5)-steroid dehydrogenase [Siccirubricoccus deserti]|uniref:Complex I NDUFA9 subunit family protein n=1 Tax=Siccirubricoccus deserti TaxID=2013562 RepID=A0A9X0QX49_9PROT|nr:complex I NDUFA9 subunit family protein [Siccirubricoccus deserti]MBC4015500.1 complex I NDUFA9 subunit family protein [Siccirubricoccus deserti]GGC42170.1 3-beta-hydroxy-Delta(5)-steroid dehydrogenase [Siccirubricoccus deserti]